MVYKTPYKIVNAVVYLRCRFIDGIRAWLPNISEFLSLRRKLVYVKFKSVAGN
jgi:hypothetical protein